MTQALKPVLGIMALLFVNMGNIALLAKNVEALLFVNMGDNALNAKNVEEFLFLKGWFS